LTGAREAVNVLAVNRTLLFMAILVSGLALAAFSADSAYACDTSFWNIGCQFYSPHEGHSAAEFAGFGEDIYATFDTYSTVLAIRTTTGGSWIDSATMPYGAKAYFYPGYDKVGCYNHHTGTMFVNCRHEQPQ
jgi:hypothetical protein